MLVSVQDRCTVCAKRTIGLENRFGHNDATPMCRGSSGAHFGLFGDSAKLDAR